VANGSLSACDGSSWFVHRYLPPAATRYARPGSNSPEELIHCLVLWNIDLTLIDVTRVTRDAYVDAFRRVTGRPLVQLPQMAGQSESEIFFEALACNDAAPTVPAAAAETADGSDELLARFVGELAVAFGARRELLASRGSILPGAREAVLAVADLPGAVQSVLTGAIRPNAVQKLRAFGLERFFDFEIGGYGSEVYPKGAQLMRSRSRAAEKYGVAFGEASTVYIGDSIRDVEAARVGGARSVGVATGRSTAADLHGAGADIVLPDLTDTSAVVRSIQLLTMPSAG
jgi:phosphoglycolate phosphatase